MLLKNNLPKKIEGCIRKYWPSVVAAWTKGSKVYTKLAITGPIIPGMAHAREIDKKFIAWHLDQSCFFFSAFTNKSARIMTFFYKISTNQKPIRTLRCTSRLPHHIIIHNSFSPFFIREINADEEDEDEVFLGPVGHRERCVSVNSGVQDDEKFKPLSPLNGEQIAELCKEAIFIHIHQKFFLNPE